MSNKANLAMTRHMTTGQLLKYVLPTIITVVFASLYGIVDGIYISNVGGELAFSSINLITPLFLIVSSIGMMFGTGGNAIVSKTRGEGHEEEAKGIFSLLTFAVIALGIIITIALEVWLDDILYLLGATEEMVPLCMTYSRILLPFIVWYMLQFYFQNMLVTAGKGLLGFAMTLAAGFTNIIGDAILVGLLAKTPEEALRGAAIATVLGLLIGGAVPFVYFLFKNSSFLRIVKPAFDLKIIIKACANGVSEFLSNISGALMTTVFNGLLLWIVGPIGVSAYGSMGYINTLFTAVFIGYSVGVAPIIAYKYGEGDTDELKYLYKKSLLVIGVVSVAMVIIGEVLCRPIAGVFSGDNKALYDMTVVGFEIYALSFLFKGYNTFGMGFFTALNNGLVAGILSTLRALVFSIGSVLIMPIVFYRIYGPDTALLGVWWSVNYAEALALVVTSVFLLANRKKYQY